MNTAGESLNEVVYAHNVGKSFNSFSAVSNISFRIRAGECFGLLGPNGAGKSTLIKMLYGVMRRTSGELSVLGLDPSQDAKSLRRQIGVVMQDDALDLAMDVRGNMLMFCGFHGISGRSARLIVDELLDFMELTPKANERISLLSGGMRRRLAFVRSLIARPRLLILDEPTTGLDPAVRQLLWDKVNKLKSQGTTVVLTTHYMDEAELLCDRLVLVDQGAIRAEGSPRALIAEHCPGQVALFRDFKQGGRYERIEAATINELQDLAKMRSSTPEIIRPASLEDVFLKLTGRQING